MTITRDTSHRQAAIANHGALNLKQQSFIDTLNMEMDPVSILTDAELQRELDFFANAQFTFDVEPGTAATKKASSGKTLHHRQAEEICPSPTAIEKPVGHAFDMEALLLDQSPQGPPVNMHHHHRVHSGELSAPSTPTASMLSSPAHQYGNEAWSHPVQSQQAAWPTHQKDVAQDFGQFASQHYASSSTTDSSSHGWSTPMPSPSVSVDGHAAGFFTDTLPEPTASISVPSTTPTRGRSRRATAQVDGRQRRTRSAKQEVILIEQPAEEEEEDGNDSEDDSEDDSDNNEQRKGKARRSSSKKHQEGEDAEDGRPTRLSKDDKRKRNTAASARFRIKKKMREQALQRTAYEMTEKSKRLELHIKNLEREIGWLKALVVEKNQARIDRLVRDRPLPSAHTHAVTLDYPSGDDNYY